MISIRQLLQQKGDTVHTIGPEATVYEALKLMAEHNVGALVVLKEGELQGIISERDYARKVILHDRRSKETRVSEIMTEQVITVSPEQLLEDCMNLMTEWRVRHLPVVEHGRLIGIISIGDVVKALISQQAFLIEQLTRYIGRR
ncbi:MAG: CBS domain-containing protein [Truepera sp.]|nr:CBS domain-containing protein [Truepera sp.]